jgi:hypothetical protein
VFTNAGQFYAQSTTNNTMFGSFDPANLFTNEPGSLFRIDNPAKFNINFQAWSATVTANSSAVFQYQTLLQSSAIHVPDQTSTLEFAANLPQENDFFGSAFDGQGSVWVSSGRVVAAGTTLGNGLIGADLEIPTGASATVAGKVTLGDDATLGTQAGNHGNLIVAPSGTLEIVSENQGVTPIGLDVTNNGQFNVTVPNDQNGGAQTAEIDGVFSNTGSLNLKKGILVLAGPSAGQTGMTASTNLLGGGLQVPGVYSIGQGTRLTGSGTITAQEVVNAGTVAPGSPANLYGGLQIAGFANSPGSGKYTQTGTGSLQLNIGDAPATGSFNTLTVYGTASLQGTLAYTIVPPFAPAQGTVYDDLASLVKWGQLDGENNKFTTEPAGWTLTYRADGLTSQKNYKSGRRGPRQSGGCIRRILRANPTSPRIDSDWSVHNANAHRDPFRLAAPPSRDFPGRRARAEPAVQPGSN